MAKYCGAVCRLCRREGEKLFLKGDRCYTEKCAIEKREGVPGQHGKGRQAFSNYKIQLREKQKIKRIYMVLEKGFRNTFERALSAKGVTGTELLGRLETRLDSVVFRLGFGLSRRHARQLVNHGHILVNGKQATIPSYHLVAGDEVSVREKSKTNVSISGAVAAAQGRPMPGWLSLDKDNLKGIVTAAPTRDQMPQNVKEQQVVELYSR